MQDTRRREGFIQYRTESRDRSRVRCEYDEEFCTYKYNYGHNAYRKYIAAEEKKTIKETLPYLYNYDDDDIGKKCRSRNDA